MVYRNHHLKRHELEVERWRFVKRLLQVQMSGEPYGYFDEMGLHGFLTMKKSWSYEHHPIVTCVNSGQRLKMSVYGTICSVVPTPVFTYKF